MGAGKEQREKEKEKETYHTQVISWMDHGTLGLLWGMMVITGITMRTGVFEWIGILLACDDEVYYITITAKGEGLYTDHRAHLPREMLP